MVVAAAKAGLKKTDLESQFPRVKEIPGPVAKAYSYDAAGNVTGDGTYTFTYNAAGRLAKVVRGNKTNTYLHNALGQRVIKTGAYLTKGPYFFLYDDAGHLVGEDKNNSPRQETVWLGDTPVAVLKQDAQGQIQAYVLYVILTVLALFLWMYIAVVEGFPDGNSTLQRSCVSRPRHRERTGDHRRPPST